MSHQTLDSASQAAVSSGSGLLGDNRSKRDTIQAYLFLLPFLVVYLIFVIYPVIQAAYMSLFKWDLLAPHLNKFIGLENYANMLGGTNITWSLSHLFVWRLLGLAFIALVIWAATRGSIEETVRYLVEYRTGGHFWGGARD